LKQALDVGNRLIMFHKGQIVLDLRGEEKRKLSVMDLIAEFNELNLMHELNDSLILG
jgi:putative ABC transport system ATP-binding protein